MKPIISCKFDGSLQDNGTAGVSWSTSGTSFVTDAEFPGRTVLSVTSGTSAMFNLGSVLGSSDFTVSFWINSITTSMEGLSVLNTSGAASDVDSSPLVVSQRMARFNGVDTSPTNNSAVTNTWVHVAAIRQSTELRHYINGSLVGTRTISGNMNSCVILRLFTSTYPSISGLSGKIANLEIIPVALYSSNFVPSKDMYPHSKSVFLTETNDIYATSSGHFAKVGSDFSSLSAEQKIALFNSIDSETDISGLNTAFMDVPTNFKIVTLTKDRLSYSKNNYSALPKPQLVTPKGLIDTTSFEKINYVTITSTESVADTSINHITLIVTTDNTTYYTWNKITLDWVEIDHTNLEQVQQNGIKPSELSTLTSADWDKLIKKPNVEGIGFAYYLEQSDFDDVVEVDEISLNVDMIGSWANAKVGTDYDYEYPSNKSLLVTLLSDGDYKINY